MSDREKTAGENRPEYKVYGMHMLGQFRERSKKAQAVFIGRSVQQLTEAIDQHREKKRLRMETLRFHTETTPAQTEDGTPVPGWVILAVICEVKSEDLYTEADRKKDEERLRKAREAKAAEERESGEAAMKALETALNAPRVEDRIQ